MLNALDYLLHKAHFLEPAKHDAAIFMYAGTRMLHDYLNHEVEHKPYESVLNMAMANQFNDDIDYLQVRSMFAPFVFRYLDPIKDPDRERDFLPAFLAVPNITSLNSSSILIDQVQKSMKSYSDIRDEKAALGDIVEMQRHLPGYYKGVKNLVCRVPDDPMPKCLGKCLRTLSSSNVAIYRLPLFGGIESIDIWVDAILQLLDYRQTNLQCQVGFFEFCFIRETKNMADVIAKGICTDSKYELSDIWERHDIF